MREDAKKPQKNLQKSQKSACIYAPLLVKYLSVTH